MDTELHHRIENLERLCEQTLQVVNAMSQDLAAMRLGFTEFREEQRKETAKTQALLR